VVSISVEPWGDTFAAEVDALARAHFAEVDGGVEPRRPYALDHALMAMIDHAGALLLVAARNGSKLVGYITWNITPDVESAGLTIAQQGAWYVVSGNPRVAVSLFDASISELKARGVQCAYPHHRAQGRGANLGRFFARRGALLTQHTYSLWIGN